MLCPSGISCALAVLTVLSVPFRVLNSPPDRSKRGLRRFDGGHDLNVGTRLSIDGIFMLAKKL
jgi:hypothetical protein